MAQKEAQHREQLDELNEELTKVRSELGDELAKVRKQNDEMSKLSRDQVSPNRFQYHIVLKSNLFLNRHLTCRLSSKLYAPSITRL